MNDAVFQARLHQGVQVLFHLPTDAACDLLSSHTPGLEPVTRGPHAFADVLALQVQALRPARVPAWSGEPGHVVLLRVRAQAMLLNADVTQGWAVLGAYATEELLDALSAHGNHPFDAFNTTQASVRVNVTGNGWDISVRDTPYARGDLSLRLGLTRPALPRDSAFPTRLDARAFAQPGLPWLGAEHRTLQRLAVHARGERPQPTALTLEHAVMPLADGLTPEAAWQLPAQSIRFRRLRAERLLGDAMPQLQDALVSPGRARTLARASA